MDPDREVMRADHGLPCDREHVVHHGEQGVIGGLHGVASVDGDVPVQDLLEYLRVGHQPLTASYALIEQHARADFVRVGLADEVHRDVRIDEDQRFVLGSAAR